LLHDITSALADLGVGIYHSRITTEKGAALDSFYIAGADGGKITDKAEQEKILQTLRVAITRTDQ
jgi:[protein-PII] uridylyltransferase